MLETLKRTKQLFERNESSIMNKLHIFATRPRWIIYHCFILIASPISLSDCQNSRGFFFSFSVHFLTIFSCPTRRCFLPESLPRPTSPATKPLWCLWKGSASDGSEKASYHWLSRCFVLWLQGVKRRENMESALLGPWQRVIHRVCQETSWSPPIITQSSVICSRGLEMLENLPKVHN